MPEIQSDSPPAAIRDTAPPRPPSARRPRRIRRGLAVVLAALVLCGLVGAAAEAWVARSDGDRYPAPGRVLTVDRTDLHIHCTGSGAPTVVLEAGLGESSLGWSDVQQALDGDLRVCSYDRAGLGWSSGGAGDWTAEQAALDLAELLVAAGEPGPYVLVAHSVGALVAREFRQAHPREVASLVLVEPTDHESVRQGGVPTVAVVERHVYGLLARTGALRWLGEWLVPAVIGDRPPRELLSQLPAAYHPGAISASLRELRGTVASAEHLLREEDRSWGGLPVTVVSAASATAADRSAHAALAARSSRGEHVVAEAGGHYVHYTERELVVDLVRTAAATDA